MRLPVVRAMLLLISTTGGVATYSSSSDVSRHTNIDRALRTTMSSSSSSSHGTIAVEAAPSTCTWNRLDVNGQCVLQPRSCYNCLNALPTTQERCTLTPDGVCMGADAYDPLQDYRRTGPSASWPPHRNYFPAANATYCEPNDSICAICRKKSFLSWATNPSQYCEGAKKCICVSICESDQWETVIQPILNETLVKEKQETTTTSLQNCTLAPVSSSSSATTSSTDASSSSSPSPSSDDFVGLPKQDVFASDDECRWYQNQTYCGAPRSCYDCLNTNLYSGNKCMLHSSGYCSSIDAYVRAKDFRLRQEVNGNSSTTTGTPLLFRSTDTVYCEQSDANCAQCRATASNFTSWASVASPPAFCIGTKGCVCVASCESPLWASAVVSLTCNVTAQPPATTSNNALTGVSSLAIAIMMLVGGLISMVCALVLLSGYKRWVSRNRSRARGRGHTRSPTGPALELSGWKAMREKLIETEREFVGGQDEEEQGGGTGAATTAAALAEPAAVAAHSHVHQPHLEPPPHSQRASGGEEQPSHRSSRAERERDEPPALLLVEEGDAYRPVSPSRMHE